MEQAFRKLKNELLNLPSIVEVKTNYYYFQIKWKYGIKERLILNKFDNNDKLKTRYLKSHIRPHFLPKALWWEELSNNKKPKIHYLENVEFEENIENFSNLVNWKWSDYLECKFFERLLLIHEILQYVIDNGWKEQRFPENTLRHSMQLIYDEGPDPYKYKNRNRKGYRTRGYNNKEKPGDKLIQHFMPYGFYGKNDPKYMLDCSHARNIRRTYFAIRNIISKNKLLKQKGRKQFLDFNYANIIKCMRDQRRSVYLKPYRMRQIGLFRVLINDLDLAGKSFYDVDPELGELHLVAHSMGCPYYYRESAPFDEHGPKMSEFLKSDCHADKDGIRYDFGIYYNNFFDYDLTKEAFEIMKNKVDLLIIFVEYSAINEWLKEYPGCHQKIPLNRNKNPNYHGDFLLYYP